MSLILKQEDSANVPTPGAGKGTLFLNASDQMVVKASDGNTSTFPIVNASGNTQVFYNDAGTQSGDASFTFNKTNDTVTIANLTVTGTLSAGDISVSSIANGTSNVDIIGTSGNVTVSVAGTANVLTVTSTGANITGTANISGNANVGNLGVTKVVATGNVEASFFIGNGSQLTGIDATLIQNGTANVRTFNNGNVTVSAAGAANVLVVTSTGANITGTANISGNANVGNLGATQLLASANITTPQFISNVSTGTAPLTVISTTKVANLNADTVDGYDTATAATANTIAIRDADGNLTANFFIGNGSQLTGLSTSSISNGNSNVSVPSANGNVNISAEGNANILVVTGTGVNVAGTFNATGIATVGGNLDVTGNAIVTGNLTVNGNLVYVNVDTLAVEDPIIQLQTGPNGAAPASNSGKDVGTALNYYDTQARVAFMGWDVSNAEFGLASVSTITNEVVTFTTYGNLRVANIAAGNLVSASYLTGTLTTAAQPNITSIGTLTSLTATGNITAGNANVSGQLISTVATGTAPIVISSTTKVANLNADTLDGYDSATAATANTVVVRNADGNITANNISGTLSTAAQTNITSVGSLGSTQISSLGVGTAASGTTGEIRATNNVTAYYSDKRLKDFHGTIPNAVEKIMQLNGYYFTENELAKSLGYNNDKMQVGVSAQEVEIVMPEVVTDAPINNKYRTVYYEKLVPLLIEGIKEQQATIQDLQKQINNLKEINK